MKNIIKMCSIAIMVIVCSCKKENNNTSLIGKWKQTEYYIGTGSNQDNWMPVSSKTSLYVQFNNNGSLGGNAFSGYVRYTIKDSNTITFYDQNNTLENYSYSITNGVLQMDPIGPIVCIEGCGSRFTKGNSSVQLLP